MKSVGIARMTNHEGRSNNERTEQEVQRGALRIHREPRIAYKCDIKVGGLGVQSDQVKVHKNMIQVQEDSASQTTGAETSARQNRVPPQR